MGGQSTAKKSCGRRTAYSFSWKSGRAHYERFLPRKHKALGCPRIISTAKALKCKLKGLAIFPLVTGRSTANLSFVGLFYQPWSG